MEDSCKSWNTTLPPIKGGKFFDDVNHWKVLKKDSFLGIIILNTRLGYSLFVRTFSGYPTPPRLRSRIMEANLFLQILRLQDSPSPCNRTQQRAGNVDLFKQVHAILKQTAKWLCVFVYMRSLQRGLRASVLSEYEELILTKSGSVFTQVLADRYHTVPSILYALRFKLL